MMKSDQVLLCVIVILC